MSGPTRTCVGCRQPAPQGELTRIVRGTDGSLAVGRTLPGRGAWLCRSADCLDLAARRKAFGRAFRAPISEGALDSLRTELVFHARIGSRDM